MKKNSTWRVRRGDYLLVVGMFLLLPLLAQAWLQGGAEAALWAVGTAFRACALRGLFLAAGGGPSGEILNLLSGSLFMLMPFSAFRLKDCGQSPWWCLGHLVPVFSWVVVGWCLFAPSRAK